MNLNQNDCTLIFRAFYYVTAGAAFNELFIAALICNLFFPLGSPKVMTLDRWQHVGVCGHMRVIHTHASNSRKNFASVHKFGKGPKGRAWAEQAIWSSLNLSSWKRCFWLVLQLSIPLLHPGCLWVVLCQWACLLPAVHAVLEVLLLDSDRKPLMSQN